MHVKELCISGTYELRCLLLAVLPHCYATLDAPVGIYLGSFLPHKNTVDRSNSSTSHDSRGGICKVKVMTSDSLGVATKPNKNIIKNGNAFLSCRWLSETHSL